MPKISIEQINVSGTPSSSTYLRGDKTWATAASGGTFLKDEFSYTASQTFTTTNPYSGVLLITVNGRELFSTQYTTPSSTTITISDTLQAGDVVMVTYNLIGDILGDIVTALNTINGQII